MTYHNPDTPQPPSEEDIALFRELALTRIPRQRFYEKLNGSLKALFSHCEWVITRHENGMSELFVVCPTLIVYRRLFKKFITIHSRLEQSVDVKHTKFVITCPLHPEAHYEKETTLQQWMADRNYNFYIGHSIGMSD